MNPDDFNRRWFERLRAQPWYSDFVVLKNKMLKAVWAEQVRELELHTLERTIGGGG